MSEEQLGMTFDSFITQTGDDETALERDCPMPRCGGKGQWFDDDGELVTCKNCRGTGRVMIPY